MTPYITPKYTKPNRGRSEEGVYVFTKTVELSDAFPAKVEIFASTRYKLYINGAYVCEGPCRTPAFERCFDTVQTDAFVKGENRIKVVVAHLAETQVATSFSRAQKPVLLMRATCGDAVVETDTSWQCDFVKNHRLMGSDTFVFPYEDVCGDAEYVPVALEENKDFDFDAGHYTANYGIVPFRMKKRELPMIYPGDSVNFSVVRKGENFVELDAGLYVTAHVKIRLRAGTNAKITYAECYTFPEGKRMRDDTSGKIEGVYDNVCAGKNDFTFESFWFRAFRYIRIDTDTPDAVISAEAARFNYPATPVGTFCCSDETFNIMNDISINTLLCCTTDIFVDCPYYEQQQYIMDSAVESAVFMRYCGDTRMVRKCIDDFAASRNPGGLLCANYPCTMTQIIPGFSIFYIYMLRDYFEYTADREFVKVHLTVVDGILSYFDSVKNADGLISCSDEWDFVDWVPGWERGVPPVKSGKPNTIYSLYYAYGLKCAAYLAKECGREGLCGEYTARYGELLDALRVKCLDKERGMYHDGCGTFSSHTVIWAILSEAVTGEKAAEMCAKLTLPDNYKSSYSMNFFLFRALEKCGMYHMAADYFDGWKKMIDLHCTTWCENPDDPRSECHAWSCAPTYEFSANVLGVKYSHEDVIVIQPQTLGLRSARGTVPTRHGNVEVSWVYDGEKFEIAVNSPENVEKRLVLPNGKSLEFFDGQKTLIM